MTQNIPSPDAAAILAALPLGRDPASIRRRIEAVERVMEGAFEIPGTSRRVGLDTLIGLIPVIGDVVAGAIGSWIVWEARNLGMSRWQLTRMGARVGFDTMLGLVPFVGDAADFFYRSNSRNLRTIKRHLDRNYPATVTINA